MAGRNPEKLDPEKAGEDRAPEKTKTGKGEDPRPPPPNPFGVQ